MNDTLPGLQQRGFTLINHNLKMTSSTSMTQELKDEHVINSSEDQSFIFSAALGCRKPPRCTLAELQGRNRRLGARDSGQRPVLSAK